MGRSGGLKGKVAIVTGAAQGIGKCIAEFLARDGASVMLADIQDEKVRKVADDLTRDGLEVDSVWVDIANPDASRKMVSRALGRFGRIDVLVNDAGIDAPTGFAADLMEEDWRQVIDVDLSGAWWCTQSVLPHMIEARTGRIIFISSTRARSAAPNISVAYNAAKAGLIGLTIGLSVQLEEYGILVNTILPGPTGTGRGPIGEANVIAPEKEFPLGIGGPEPIAHACLYLTRESGDWISGSVLNVSGGRLRG